MAAEVKAEQEDVKVDTYNDSAADEPPASTDCDKREAEKREHDDEAKATTGLKEEAEIPVDAPASQSAPSDSEVAAKLNEYLSDASLSLNVTERQLRSRLEEHFGTPLKDRKAVIRHEVVEWLSKKQEAEGVAEEADAATAGTGKAKPKKPRKSTGKKASLLSEQLQAFLGVERMNRFQVTKQIWAYIKEHNLQRPDNRQYIILDEKLETIFTPPLHMMQMAKQLTKHIYTDDAPANGDEGKKRRKSDDEEEEEEGEEDGDEKPAKRRKSTKPAGKGRGKGGFSKPLKLSEIAQEWYGEGLATRAKITKRFFEYIKEHNLKDPSNGAFVLCDETLKKITGEDRVKAFGAIKYFSDHILGYADEEAVAAAEPEAASEVGSTELSD